MCKYQLLSSLHPASPTHGRMPQLWKVPVPENTLQHSRHLGAPSEALLVSGKWVRREHRVSRAVGCPAPTTNQQWPGLLTGWKTAQRGSSKESGRKQSFLFNEARARRALRFWSSKRTRAVMGENVNPMDLQSTPRGILSDPRSSLSRKNVQTSIMLQMITRNFQPLPIQQAALFRDLKGHLKATHQGPPTRGSGGRLVISTQTQGSVLSLLHTRAFSKKVSVFEISSFTPLASVTLNLARCSRILLLSKSHAFTYIT